MRIAFVLYGSLETLSGGYLYDRKLVAQLRGRGHDVRLYSLPWRSWPQHLADNLRIGFANQIITSAPDLILQDELNHPSLVWLNRYLRSRSAAPIVTIVHHLRANEEHPALLLPLYRTVESAYLRTVDGFIWNSQTTRQSVLALRRQRLFGAHTGGEQPEAPGVVAYPGIGDWVGTRATSLHERNSGAPLVRLLFIGNLIPRKRLDVLLRALQNAPRALSLDVVGSDAVDPAHAAAMRKLAADLQLTDRVRFHGALSDAALLACARAADLLVVPSFEGFGIVYLEAMALGIPVIASSAGAASEIVQNGRNGYLVPLGDSAELTRRLQLLRADPATLAALRAGARATFAAFPTWEASSARAANWLEAYAASWHKPTHTADKT